MVLLPLNVIKNKYDNSNTKYSINKGDYMKKLKIVSLIIISLLVLVGCSKKQEELPKEESKEEQVEVVFENSPKNIAEGGKIAKFKDTYYYSEIKDNGKLYSKSTKKTVNQ